MQEVFNRDPGSGCILFLKYISVYVIKTTRFSSVALADNRLFVVSSIQIVFIFIIISPIQQRVALEDDASCRRGEWRRSCCRQQLRSAVPAGWI